MSRLRGLQGVLNLVLHTAFSLLTSGQEAWHFRGTMSRPKIHYSVVVRNQVTGDALKVELVDLPFPSRSFRLRVNGRWAEKIPVGSKSAEPQCL